MWNVVRMEDGKFYLADVTYSDNSQIGKDSVFMVHASGNGQKYVVSAGSRQYTYTYRDDYKDLSTDGFLPISSAPYTPNSNPPAPAFADVPAGEYYAKPVAWAVQSGITNGTSDTTFSPDEECRQAQILTFLYRAARGQGTAEADDMDKAVSWARERGMIDDSFDGAQPCTRATAVSYIWQAFDRPEAEQSSFTDVDAQAGYAGAVSWAVAVGITNGDGGETVFSPDRVCSRGQIVTFLHRAYVEEARLTAQ